MQKMVIYQAMEASRLMNAQRTATEIDGIDRYSPAGLNFKARVGAAGWKQAAREQGEGDYNWTNNKPFDER